MVSDDVVEGGACFPKKWGIIFILEMVKLFQVRNKNCTVRVAVIDAELKVFYT